MACRIAAFQSWAWLTLRLGSLFFPALKPESHQAVQASYPGTEKERGQGKPLGTAEAAFLTG